MPKVKLPSPRKSSTRCLDQKYLDDYEIRLEQAESGIRDLTINLSKHLFDQNGDTAYLENKSPPYSSLVKNACQRDSRVYSPLDYLKRHHSPTPCPTSLSRSQPITPHRVRFAPVKRDFSRETVSSSTCINTDKENSLEFKVPKLHSPKLDDYHHAIHDLRQTLEISSTSETKNASTQTQDCNVSRSSTSKQDSVDIMSRQNQIKDTCEKRYALHAPSALSSSIRERSCTPRFDSYMVHSIKRDAEKDILEKTEEIQKKINLELQNYKHKIDEEFDKRIKVVKEEISEEEVKNHQEGAFTAVKLTHTQSEALSWKKKYEDLSKMYEDLTRQTAIFTKKCERSEITIEELETECNQLQAQLTRLKKQNELLEIKDIHQRGCIERLQCDLDNVFCAKSSEAMEKRDLERKINALEQDKTSCEHQLYTIGESYKQMEENLSSTRSKLAAAEIKLDESSTMVGKLQRKVTELENELTQRRESEVCYAEEAERLKHREHNLQQQIRNLLQKCSENDECLEKNVTLSHDYEQLKNKVVTLSEEISTANAEIKLLTSQKEKLIVELRTSCNDNLLLTQENVKLRKENKEIRSSSGNSPIPKDPVISFPLKIPTPREINSTESKLPQYKSSDQLENSTLTSKHPGNPILSKDSSLCTVATEKIRRQAEATSCRIETDHTETSFVKDFPGALNGCPLSCFTTDGLEKQLTLLEIEKNQIQSDLARLPGSQNGIKCEERLTRIKLEESLQNAETNIQRIRQALRFSGASKRSARYTYF